jgi:PAS domain S-box-containing protein
VCSSDLLVLYLPAVTFLLIDLLTFQINAEPQLKYWGYNDVISGLPIYYISAIWTAILPVLAFVLCFRYYKSVTKPTERQQAKYVTVGFAIPIATFIVTNILTRALNVDFPNLGISATLFFSLLVSYAIVKYDLFTLDAELVFEQIITTIPDAFVFTDEKAHILRVNDQIVDLVGFSKEEMTSKKLSFIFAEKQEETLNYILTELKNRSTLTNYDLQLKTKTGEIKQVLFSGAIVPNNKGEPLGITCIMKDVTSRIEMENKLLKSERLASIGELAGQIGHDLRNPLAAIKSSVYLIKNKNASMSEAERLKVCSWIETAIEDSDRIVNSLVEYSADFQLQFEKCTPKSLTVKALSKLEVPENVKVVNLTADEPELWLDAQKMEIVFGNIIQNAYEAMPSGGQLIISSVNQKETEVSFTDSGTGIPESILPKMFSPLNTTKAKGMGMSLATSKRIVTAHGGKINFTTSKEKGTTFTVILPKEVSGIVKYHKIISLPKQYTERFK